jgi:ABC-type branched-subunit amino acid transport system ATPase component
MRGTWPVVHAVGNRVEFVLAEHAQVGSLIGPNGAGKSALLNLISRLFGVSAGDILVNGQSIAGLRPFEINRRGLSRSFQITRGISSA